MIPPIPVNDRGSRHLERDGVPTSLDQDRYVIGGLAVGIVGLTMGDALITVAGLAIAVAMIKPPHDSKPRLEKP